MLSLERPSARMYRLAGFPVHGEPYQSLDQVLAAVAGLYRRGHGERRGGILCS